MKQITRQRQDSTKPAFASCKHERDKADAVASCNCMVCGRARIAVQRRARRKATNAIKKNRAVDRSTTREASTSSLRNRADGSVDVKVVVSNTYGQVSCTP